MIIGGDKDGDDFEDGNDFLKGGDFEDVDNFEDVDDFVDGDDFAHGIILRMAMPGGYHALDVTGAIQRINDYRWSFGKKSLLINYSRT